MTIQLIGGIGNPGITGSITSLNIPQVKAGQQIVMNISYDCRNPDGSWFDPWKFYLVAKDSLGNKKLVKTADVRADYFKDSDSLNLWSMPSQNITIEIRMYGHNELESWNWNWW